MHHDAPHRLSNEAPGKLLLDALLRREFAVYYQPQYEVLTGAPVALEVLLRWYHPERGTVPASEFMRVAEDSGAIVPIGAWALATAGRDTAPWLAAWPALRLSVNLSARQLAEPHLGQQVIDTLSATGLSPARVDVEVRASVLAGAGPAARAELARLQAAGASLVLDDFPGGALPPVGEGLRVDGLKLDRRLSQGALEPGPARDRLLEAVAAGASLPLGAAAMAVEDPRQREALLGLGVRRMQGFLFCRPGPAAGLGAIELRNLPLRPRRG